MAAAPRNIPLGEDEHVWLARAFRKIDFFKGLTMGQLELILPNIERFVFADGTAAIDAGDEPRGVHLIYRGKASVRRKTWLLGRAKEVAMLGPEEVFGEMAILEGRRHQARVQAVGELETFIIQAKHFRYVLERNPGLADHFKAIVANRILRARRALEESRA